MCVPTPPSWVPRPRYTEPTNGEIVHAAIELPNGAVVALAEEEPRYGNVAASSLEASPVLLACMVEDPDATAAAMAEHGGEILIPIDDRFYGHRENPVRDAFGHQWIIGKGTETLSSEEIERRMRGRPGRPGCSGEWGLDQQSLGLEGAHDTEGCPGGVAAAALHPR